LTSQFLLVLEPYEGLRPIQRIERLHLAGGQPETFPPVGVRVTTDEFVDTLIFQPGAGTGLRNRGRPRVRR